MQNSSLEMSPISNSDSSFTINEDVPNGMSMVVSPFTNRSPIGGQESNISTPLSYSAVYSYQNLNNSGINEFERSELPINQPNKAKISIFNSSYLSTENLLDIVTGQPLIRRRHRIKKHSWIIPVCLLVLFILILLAVASPVTTLSPLNPFNSDLLQYPLFPLPEGAKLHLSSPSLGGKFIRLDPTSSFNQLTISETIPWRHGKLRPSSLSRST